EEELDAEIKAHIAAEMRLRIERGETPERAATNARRDFGNVGLIKEVTREAWGWMSLERLNEDIQYALRGMRRSPGVSVLVLMSLALAIGANTAIFSLIHAVLLKDLPVRNPEQLVEFLWVLNPDVTVNSFSYPALDYFRNHTQTLQSVIGSARNRFYVEYMNGAPERVNGEFVTGNYFEALGVETTAGRPINLADDRMGSGNAVAVIGYGTWQNRFRGDPGVIGKTVKVEEVPLTIIGVAPPEFHGTQVGLQNGLWIPLAMEPRMRQRSMTSSAGYKWIQLLGRLKSGTSIQSARAELQVLFRQAVIENELPLQPESAMRQKVLGWTIRVESASHGLSNLARQFS